MILRDNTVSSAIIKTNNFAYQLDKYIMETNITFPIIRKN